MKSVILVMIAGLCSVNLFSQSRFPPVDKSPLDISYYPANYPILKIQDKITDPLMARVVYSRPQKNGRKVFGELVEYGSVWRLGANEATELELFRDAKIGDTRVKKGRYTLYAIPTENRWTLILNKETDTWGAFRFDEKKDIVKVQVPVIRDGVEEEAFSINFEKEKNTVFMVIAWDDELVKMPISFF